MSRKKEDRGVIARRKLTHIPARQRLLILFLFIAATAALVFTYKICGSSILDIINDKETVYYDWRHIVLVLLLPVFFYADALIFSMLLFPLTRNLLEYILKGIMIVTIYAGLAFLMSYPLSLVIHIYWLDSEYYKCDWSGPYYVKKKEMCKQFEYIPESESDSQSSAIIPDKDNK